MTTTTKPRKAGTLLNVSRAAELLGLHADTITDAIKTLDLPVVEVEGSGGRLSPVIAAGDLRRFQKAKVKEWKARPSEGFQARADLLEAKVL